MGIKYQFKPDNKEKTAIAKADSVRVHFKNTYEVANVIKGMHLRKAKRYLHQVLAKQRAVPFRKYNGGPGRHAQAKEWGLSQCRWPVKSVFAMLKILQNAEANAVTKGLEKDKLVITHAYVNRAPLIRRRTFRAHGRINPYMCSPTHIQIVLTESAVACRKPAAAAAGAEAIAEDVPELE